MYNVRHSLTQDIPSLLKSAKGMTASAPMANALLNKLLADTLGWFKVILQCWTPSQWSKATYSVPPPKTGCWRLPLRCASSDKTDWDSYTQSTNHLKDKQEAYKNDAQIIGEFSRQNIVENMGAGKQMTYAGRRYTCGPHRDTKEQTQLILKSFITRYWRRLNRGKASNG